MSLKSELRKLRRELADAPQPSPDGLTRSPTGKIVLPPGVWAAIAGTIPWDALTADERDVWDACLDHSARRRAELTAETDEAMLAALGTPPPPTTTTSEDRR